ncbi:MAG TPA: hypothetical protein VNO55_05380, partial [Polyangia bacterium]|nr:hypothetical protein [Polyangia bacterium]
MATTALLIAVVVAQAAAGPMPPASPVDLSWTAPAGCPRAETVRASIARGVASGTVARVRADIVVVPVDADHWRATVNLQGADWSAARTLKGPTCAAVADAAGLVIVLALATELLEPEAIVEAPPLPPPPPPPAL